MAVHRERVIGGVRLGQALEQARTRLGYSLETAATVLGISPRLLGHLEAGLRTPTEGLLAAICETFGLDRARLGTRAYLPRLAPHLNQEETILWLGWLPIQLPPGYSDDYLIRSIGSTIRTMRSLDTSQPVYLRAVDIPLIVSLIDAEDPNLPAAMIRHLGLTLSEAVEEIQRMQSVLNELDPWPPEPEVSVVTLLESQGAEYLDASKRRTASLTTLAEPKVSLVTQR